MPSSGMSLPDSHNSSDGSFTPGSMPVPALVLSAFYGAGHEVEITWGWIYQIGETRIRAPLVASEPIAVFRDLAREREILAGLGICLDQFTPHVILRDIDTMRFTMVVLPRIRGRPDVLLDIDGVPPVYRVITADTIEGTVLPLKV
jgi:hypothetical protein